MTERRIYVRRPPASANRDRVLDIWLQQLADAVNSLPSFVGTDSNGLPILGVQADTVLPGDAGQVLRSEASTTDWSTATFPDDATAGDVLHASAGSTWSGLAIGSGRQLLQVNAGGTLPEWASNIDVPGTLDVTGAAVLDSTVSSVGAATLDTGANGSSFGGALTITGDATHNGKVRFHEGNQNYVLEGEGDFLKLIAQGAGSGAKLEISAFNADGTDDVAFVLDAIGDPADTDREQLELLYLAASTRFEIVTSAGGTGSVRDLVLYTGSNTDQLELVASDGSVALSGLLDLSATSAGTPVIKITATSDTPASDPTTDAPAGWLEIDVGGASRYIPFYT